MFLFAREVCLRAEPAFLSGDDTRPQRILIVQVPGVGPLLTAVPPQPEADPGDLPLVLGLELLDPRLELRDGRGSAVGLKDTSE